MVILAVDIRGICYYGILNEEKNNVRYLQFLKRLMDI